MELKDNLRITLAQVDLAWEDPQKNRNYLGLQISQLTGKSDLWISGDGARLAATVGKRDGDGPVQPVVKFWNSGTGEELAAVPLPSQRISSVRISADGSRIAFASHSAANEDVASG